MMHISRAGIDLIKEFESFFPLAYVCPGGRLTIGYGHTSDAGPPVVRVGDRITHETALEILASDLEPVERQVEALVKVPLTQGQFDALVSFTFNCGCGALASSTLLRRVNAGASDAAIEQALGMWNKAQGRRLAGLVRRRAAEAELFSTGAWTPHG
jgi:lysozyme